jgi:ABC-type glycerol-3-phosphate transport system substrate-binding protein
MAFSNGGAYTSADHATATIDTPEVKTMAQLVADMFTEKSLVRAADVGAGWCGEAIGKQLVGMTTEGGWMVNYMNQTYAGVNWKTVLIPAGPKTRADVIFTNAIGINANTQYPIASADFLFFVTGEANQAVNVAKGFGASTHPDQKNLLTEPNNAAMSAGGYLPDTRVAYWGPYTGKVNDSVSKALERVFAGDQTVDEAFAQAQAEAQAALLGH